MRLLTFHERSLTLSTAGDSQVVVEFDNAEKMRQALEEWFALGGQPLTLRNRSYTAYKIEP